MSATYDLTIRRGNTSPIVWRFKDADGNLLDLTDWQFRLTVSRTRAAENSFYIEKRTSDTSAAFAVDLDAATLTWRRTLAESRLVPLGRLSVYQLERILNDEQDTIAAGAVIGVSGQNDD